jgi:hypothetical protein
MYVSKQNEILARREQVRAHTTRKRALERPIEFDDMHKRANESIDKYG